MSLLFYNYFETSITYFMMMINEQYLHCITWYTGTFGRTAIGLLYRIDPVVTYIYGYAIIGLRFNSCLNVWHGYSFASSLGHPRSGSIRLLICVQYPGLGVVLQIPWDNANPAKKELISWVNHMKNSYDHIYTHTFSMH